MTGFQASPELLAGLAVAGFAFGLAYFAAMRRTAARFAACRGLAVPVALTVVRIAAAALFLGLAAKMGAAQLLATFAGFLVARIFAMRAAGRNS
jgi:hypothetical protein